MNKQDKEKEEGMAIIKTITSVTSEGVSFELTDDVKMIGGRMVASKWYVSWDKIGKALFGDQYSESSTVKDLDHDRKK